eukprot:425354-Lingulodinium_polyedra.AAC.1
MVQRGHTPTSAVRNTPRSPGEGPNGGDAVVRTTNDPSARNAGGEVSQIGNRVLGAGGPTPVP